MLHLSTTQAALLAGFSTGAQRLAGLVLAYQNGEQEFTLPQNWLWPQLGLTQTGVTGQEITARLAGWTRELRRLFPHFTMRVGDNDIPSGDTIVTIHY